MKYLNFSDFYKGNLSLRISFWIYFVVLYAIFFRIITSFIFVVFKDVVILSNGFNIIGLLNLLFYIFIFIGTWRSASNLSGKTYQNERLYMNMLWSWLAKFFLILNLGFLIYHYVLLFY